MFFISSYFSLFEPISRCTAAIVNVPSNASKASKSAESVSSVLSADQGPRDDGAVALPREMVVLLCEMVVRLCDVVDISEG